MKIKKKMNKSKKEEIIEALNAEIEKLEEEFRKNGIEFCDDDEIPDYDYLRSLSNQQKGIKKAIEIIRLITDDKDSNTSMISISPEIAERAKKLMGIYSKQGTAIKLQMVNGEVFGGYDGDKKMALNYLKPDVVYHVQKIEVGDWDSDVYLEEVPNIPFNTVMFETVKK